MYVRARPDEPFEMLWRRFKTGLERSGILREVRRRLRFTSRAEIRRLKIARSRRRVLRAARSHPREA